MRSVRMTTMLKSPERMALLKSLMTKIVPENRIIIPRSKNMLRR